MLFLGLAVYNPSNTAHAATGAINHTINFQGKLVNTDGTNVTDGSYSIVFSLYNVSSAGTNIWTETDSVTTLNGIFQVNLGLSCSFTTPAACNGSTAVDFNNDTIYLGVKVGADAEMTPRVQFTSVPQAFNSEKLGGLDKTGFIQNQTASPQTADFNISGAGTVGTSITVPLLQSAAGAGLAINGGTTLSLLSNTTNAASFDSGTTGAVNIGTNANAKTVTIGNVTGATAVVVDCGTGGCSFGASATAHTTTLGSVNSTSSTVLQAGTGGITIGGGGVANTIQIGTTTGTVTQSINIGSGGAAGSTTNVTLGSTVAGTTTIQNVNTINLNAATVVGNATTQNVFNTVATTINIGGAATTLSVGAAAGTTTINGNLTVAASKNLTVTNLSTAGIVTNTAGGVLGTVASVPAANGGTGQTTYAVGDLLYASTTSALSRLTAGTANYCLLSGGAGTAPTWSPCTTTLTATNGLNITTNQVGLGGTLNNSTTTLTAGGTSSKLQLTSAAAPAVDLLSLSATSVTTAGVNAMSIVYSGGAAAVESAATRIDLTPGTTSGGTWNGFRFVPNATGAVAGVTENGIKLDTLTTPGAGTENGIYIGQNYDSILNYNGTSLIGGTGLIQNAAIDSTLSYTNLTKVGALTSGSITSFGTIATGNTIQGTSITASAALSGQSLSVSGFTVNSSGAVTAATGYAQASGNFAMSGTGTFATGTGTVALNGATTVKPANSSSAFSVQTSTSGNLFNVDTSNQNVSINSANGGQLAPFATNTNTLPIGRNHMGQAYYNGYVYVTGGTDGTTVYNNIYYAKVNANGSTGAWATNTSTLPVTLTEAKTVISNGYFYVLGGDNTSAAVATVYYAKINADGSLGTFQTAANALPAIREQGMAVSYNGFIYYMGGSNNAAGQNTVYYAKTNPDGSVGTWTTSANTLPAAVYQNVGGVANGYVYSMGGLNSGGTAVLSSIYYAKLNTDGSTSAFATATATLPTTLRAGTVGFANGFAYYLGGANTTGASAQSAVYYIPLNTATGNITGTFTTNTNALPAIRNYASTIVANGYIYEIGGSDGTIFQTTVYYASTSRVAINGSVDLVGTSSYNLAEGGTGGSLTAGNTAVVGTLSVQDAAGFNATVAINNTLTVQGASSHVGIVSLGAASSATGQLTFYNATNANTVSLLSGTTSTAYTLTLAPTGATGTQCLQSTSGSTSSATVLTWAACGGASSLQAAYTGSTGGTTPEILLDTIRNGLDIQDANTTLGANTALLAVRGSATATTLGSPLLVVNGNGNVGVGIAVPTAQLQISGAGGGSALFKVTDTTATAQDVVTIADGGGATFRNQTDSLTAFQIQNAAGTPVLTTQTTDNSLTVNQGPLLVNGLSSPVTPTLASVATTGTLAAATYYYRVSATSNAGETTAVASSPASVTTSGTTSKNTVSWASVTNATGYKVYRSTDNATWFVNALPSGTLSLVDNGSTYTWATGATPNLYQNYTGKIQLNPGAPLIFDGSNQAASLRYDLTSNNVTLTNLAAAGAFNIQADSFAFQNTTGYNQDFAIANTGAALFKNRVNAISSFQVQPSGSSTPVLDVDTTNSRLGVGTAAPSYKLDVQGGDINTSAYYRQAGNIVLNTTSVANGTFVGKAGNQTSTGLTPTAVGSGALGLLTTGDNNAALGYHAGYSIGAGNSNTAIGAYALEAAGGSNNNNSAVGTYALQSITGFNDTAVGQGAGANLTSGNALTFLGYQAGNTDSGGSFKTINGLTNSAAIGNLAQVQASNSIVLGSIDTLTNVGIGTTIPLNTFSVSPVDTAAGTASQSTTTVTGVGTAFSSTMIGEQFIFANGATGTITAVASTTSLTLSTSQTVTSQAYRIHKLGLQVTSAGSVGIGTSSPSNLLDVESNNSTVADLVRVQNNYNTVAGIVLGTKSSGSSVRLYAASSNSDTTNDFTVWTGGAEHLRLDSSGNLGINLGGSLPSYNFDVQGTTGARIKTTTNTSTAFQVQNTGGASLLTVDTLNNAVTLGGPTTTVAAATPAFVKQTTGSSNTATATQTVSVTSTAGHLLVATIGVPAQGSPAIRYITDSAGNTWNRAAVGQGSATNSRVEIWYAANANPVTQVSITFESAVAFTANISEYSGVALTSPVDESAGSYDGAASTTATTSGIATTAANELVIAFTNRNTAATATATPAGYTALTTVTNTVPTSQNAAYLIKAAAGATSASWTLSASSTSGTAIVAFLPMSSYTQGTVNKINGNIALNSTNPVNAAALTVINPTTNATNPVAIIQGAAGQSANLFQVQDATAAPYLQVGATGSVGIGMQDKPDITSDGFESGTINSSNYYPINGGSVDTVQKHSGTYSYRQNVSNGVANLGRYIAQSDYVDATAYVYTDSASTVGNPNIFEIGNDSNSSHFAFYRSSGDSSLRIYNFYSGTDIAVSASTLPLNQWNKVEMKMSLLRGVMTVTGYLNGVQILSGSTATYNGQNMYFVQLGDQGTVTTSMWWDDVTIKDSVGQDLALQVAGNVRIKNNPFTSNRDTLTLTAAYGQGASGADLLTFQDQTGTAKAYVDAYGNGHFTDFTVSDLTVNPYGSAIEGVHINAASGQTADLLHIQDSSSNPLFIVNGSGKLAIGQATATYKLDLLDSANTYITRIKNSNAGTATSGVLIDLPTTATSGRYVGFAHGGTVGGNIGVVNGTTVAYSTTGADYSEYFAADPGHVPAAGELVALDTTIEKGVVAGADGMKTAVGVVSTAPGFVGNSPVCLVDDPDCDAHYREYNAIVALSGQVPVKVSVAGGAIHAGDAIGFSTVAGIGQRVTSGPIVGYAQQATSVDGTIQVLIRPGSLGLDGGDLQASSISGTSLQVSGDVSIGGSTTIASDLNVGGVSTLKDLIVTGDAVLKGTLSVTGNASFAADLTVLGHTTVADLTVNGHVITAGTAPATSVLTAAGQNATVTIDGNDTSGTITILGGSSGSGAGDLASVVFSKAFGRKVQVSLTPANIKAADMHYFVAGETDKFTLSTTTPPAAGETYVFSYFVRE